MIWLKRLIPFVLIALIWGGYNYYNDKKEQDELNRLELYSYITARVWIASATYRDNSDQFIAYRDSLLTSNSVTISELQNFMDKYNDTPEELEPYALRVNFLIDSLLTVEDSLSLEADSLSVDSVIIQ